MLTRTAFRRAAAAASATAAHERFDAATLLTDGIVNAFNRDGIACIPRFISPEQCDELRAQAAKYIEDEAKRRAESGDTTKVAHFNTETKEHADNEYFMTSGNKIRFFLESGCEDVSLSTVNKIGHALHTDGGVFQRFCKRPEFGGLLRRLGQKSPTAIQSMYILKPPKVGGVVVPHQDSTWLHTSPLSVIGVWFALEDCSVQNSCLQALKGSHFTHPLKARALLDEGSTLTQTLHGELPDVKLEDMEPLECPKGSLVFFNGQCIHASGPNTSTKSRHAFVFHSVDSRCTWNERNWIAPTVSRLAL
uniref:Fe2OG dioxygenase domain-containing protein n=1 Tax=Neobodo designis TaxID=312471 RepID=A0A7S1Q7T2_NEODS|mmetsp:Transcript_36471/g.112377  ORF Transcript_36471/g.112377 Transcript_36471/m.112377 type:complete len:306 (+) Transcript_36471:71-988(+)